MIFKHGVTRIVLLVGRWAVKVPRPTEWRLFLRGLLANLQERQWSKCGDERLAKVLWADPTGFLLVMERVDPLPRRFTQRHLDCILAQGRFDGLPLDQHLQNFGFRGRRLVLLDYGS